MFLYYLRKLPSDYALISDSFGSVRKPCGHNILKKFQYCNVRIQILLRHYKLSMSDNRLIGYQYYNSSFTINHPHGFRTDPFFHFQLPYEVMKQYHTQSHSRTFRRESCHSKRQSEHHCYCNGNPSYDYFATFHSSIQLLAVKSVCEPNCLNSFISCFRKRLSISKYCF